MSGRRAGFTLIEVSIALFLWALLATSLYRINSLQTFFNNFQETRASAHDDERLLASLVAADLREAAPLLGDVKVAADSIRIRMPSALGVVCGADAGGSPAVLAVRTSSGPTPTASDSLLVYATTSPHSKSIGVTAASSSTLACAYQPSTPTLRLQLTSAQAADVPVGAPVRAFRWVSYREIDHGGERWVGRTVGTSTEPIIGPIVTGSLDFARVDSLGQVVFQDVLMRSVRIELVRRHPELETSGGRSRDTLSVLVRSRNR